MRDLSAEERAFVLAADKYDDSEAVQKMRQLWAQGDIDPELYVDDNRWTALLTASFYGRERSVDFLLDECHANPDAKLSPLGGESSCLIMAALSKNSYVFGRILKALQEKYRGEPERFLEAISYVDQYGRSAKRVLQTNQAGDSLALLQKAGETGPLSAPEGEPQERNSERERAFVAAADLSDDSKAVAEMRKLWKKGGIDPNAYTESGRWTALLSACYEGHTKCVDFLLDECGADPDARQNTREENTSCLAMAAISGNRDVFRRILGALREKYREQPELFFEAISYTDRQGISAANTLERQDAHDSLALLHEALETGAVPGGGVFARDIAAVVSEPPPRVFRVGIIGGGFSGTATAIELLRQHGAFGSRQGEVEVTLFEGKPSQLAGGVAYSSAMVGESYRLNLPADRMAKGFEPSFAEYIARHAPRVPPHAVPRHLVQSYMGDLLRDAFRDANRRITLTVREGVVSDLHYERNYDGGDRILVSVDQALQPEIFDAAVLATGHMGPQIPGFIGRDLLDSGRVLSSPWGGEGDRFLGDMDRTGRVLILGTGMTAYDVAANLKEREHTGPITMMSRHARTHFVFDREVIPGADPDVPAPSDAIMRCESIDSLVRNLAIEFQRATRRFTPMQVLESWERRIPALVGHIEQNRLGRYLLEGLLWQNKSLIDTLRVGVNFKVGDAVEQLRASGQLSIVPASVDFMNKRKRGGGVRVVCSTDVAGRTRRFATYFNYVVCAMGMNTDIRRTNDPLMKLLDTKGMVRRHWTGLGIETDPRGRVFTVHENVQGRLFAVGPMRTGQQMVDRGRLGPIAANATTIAEQAREAAAGVLMQVPQP